MEYITKGIVTEIYVTKFKGKEKERKFIILIDTEDLEMILSYAQWNITTIKKTRNYYTATTTYLGSFNGKGMYKTTLMHRIIMNAKKGTLIDHINHNPIDNRKENLRVITDGQNNTSRKSKNSNNKSGYRNVFWSNTDNRWLVSLQVNGKNTCFGRFKLEDVDKAGIIAEQKRNEIYGDFKGLN